MKLALKLSVAVALAAFCLRPAGAASFQSYGTSINQTWRYTLPTSAMIITRVVAYGALSLVPSPIDGEPPNLVFDSARMMGLVAGPSGLVHQATAVASGATEITDERRNANCTPGEYVIVHGGQAGTATGYAYVRGQTDIIW